ncbi:unnamed protein product [Arctogadus glacialis]
MTKTKASGECPICGNILKFVAKHLREIHSLKNIRERGILNVLATGRTIIPAGPCPLPGCSPHLLCVEKHIRTHTEVRKLTVDREIRALKRATAINQLAALRATDPHPPMISTLDQTEDQAQQSDPEAGVSMCKKRTCVNARLRVRELESELADLRTRLVQLQAKRRPRQAAPAPAPIPAPEEEEEEEEEPLSLEEEEPSSPEEEAPATATAANEEEEALAPAPIPAPEEEEEEEEEEEKDGGGGCTRDVSASRVLMSLLKGKSRGSTIRKLKFGTSIDTYLEEYGKYLYCPEGTKKMRENSVSKASRAKLPCYPESGWPGPDHNCSVCGPGHLLH